MFALRRAAARAVCTQPARQLSTLGPAQSRVSQIQSHKPLVYRSFHQSRIWLAEEEQKKPAEQAEASPAEAESSAETVTTEPSAEEQKEIKEESIATPDVADAAQEQTKTEQVTAQAQSAVDSVQGAVLSAARSVSDAASSASSGQWPPRRSGANADDGATPAATKILYVGNLFFEVTTPQLEAEFAKFGEIANTRIVTDGRGLSKGFAYVEFTSQDSADRAMRELDQVVFQGRRLAVQYHVRRQPKRANEGGSDKSREISGPTKTLFIGNMSYQMSDRDLNDLFREIRNVLDVRVAIDRRSGQPRGFAHADFIDVASAETAKAHLEKKTVYGRQLRVDFTQSSRETAH